jgi:hypothetical protein
MWNKSEGETDWTRGESAAEIVARQTRVGSLIHMCRDEVRINAEMRIDPAKGGSLSCVWPYIFLVYKDEKGFARKQIKPSRQVFCVSAFFINLGP